LSTQNFEIQTDEEFACVVLSGCQIGLHEIPDPANVGNGFWVSHRPPFKLDDEWRRQLGLIVSERIEKYSNFVITAKGPFTADRLSYRAEHLLWGIAAGVGIPEVESGDIVLGNLGEVAVFRAGVRVDVGLQRIFRTYGVSAPQATLQDLRDAACLAESIEQMGEERDSDLATRPTPFNPIYFRLVSGLAGFQLGIRQRDPAERLHQFVRAIESFFPPDKIWGRNDLVSCLAPLIVPHADNAETMLQLYDLRSAAEHHRIFDQKAFKNLPKTSNPNEVALRRTRQAEALARELYRRFLGRRPSNLSAFRDEASQDAFWSNLSSALKVWGALFDLQAIA
jgi:hypothetical protein